MQKAFEDKQDLSLEEAIDLVKNNASAKFDETVDIAINLGVVPKHADQMVRGVCSASWKWEKSDVVFAKGEKLRLRKLELILLVLKFDGNYSRRGN